MTSTGGMGEGEAQQGGDICIGTADSLLLHSRN